MRPGFSVTSARAPPGRKAMAQGDSKVATGEILNGGSPESWPTMADGADPQAARTRKLAACMMRILIKFLPFP